jgi:hypothetical protein
MMGGPPPAASVGPCGPVRSGIEGRAILSGLGVSGLGVSGLGVSGLGVSGLGVSGLGVSGLGVSGLGAKRRKAGSALRLG